MISNYYTTICCFIFLILMEACTAPAQENASEELAVPAVTLPVKSFIFGDDKPFPQCHASTLVRLDNGQFLVAWFGGQHEKHDDVGIWISKGRPGSWTDPREVAKLREDPHWNPVLFQSPQGKIFLFFKVGKSIDHWETWVKTSEDYGTSWSEAYQLVAGDRGGRGPVRNKPIVLSDGSWLAGASHEDKKVWDVFVDRSTDQGKTWQTTEYLTLDRQEIKGEGVIQPALWESAPGKVHMLMRSSAGVICRSDSEDYGKTWSAIYKTGLPNPNSGIDLTRLPEGTLALAYNRDDENWGSRAPLSVALSMDNGRTWPHMLDIETGGEEDEFSYPAVISFGDTIAMTYTWQREKIAFWMGLQSQIPPSGDAMR